MAQLSGHLSIYLSIYLSLYLSTYLSIYLPYRIDDKTLICIHKLLFGMAFQHAKFCTYADFCTGEHKHWLDAHQLKTERSTSWKPTVSVMKQISSRLEDLSNTFLIKDGFK